MTHKLGRRPPKNAPAIRFASIATGQVPDHPAAADYLSHLGGGWLMLGNDKYGDCVAVTWSNLRRLVTATLTGHEVYPDQDQVFAFYKTQNPGFPGEDNGMDIQTALESLVKDGGPDGVKAVAFAKVDHTDPDECKAAIALAGLWTGINVDDAQQEQFSAGEPWDVVPGSAEDGGHSVLTGGYGAGGSGALGGDERFITWAEETSFTDAFWQRQVEELWLVIWPEMLGTVEFEQGVDVAKLAQEYAAITGKTLVVPDPPSPAPPSPTPTPPPVPPQPEPTPASLLQEIEVLLDELWHLIEGGDSGAKAERLRQRVSDLRRLIR